MIDAVPSLSARALEQLAGLERRVVAADGGRLKLEWGTLRSRTGDAAHDVLWWDGDRLVGFLGLYGFGPPDIELGGMVDPQFRRRGIGSQLLAAALPLAREGGYTRALLVTPRTDSGGRDFAAHHGAELEHSEYALVQREPPPAAADEGADETSVLLRPANLDDVAVLARLLVAGFGDEVAGIADRVERDLAPTRVIERDGAVIGTLRLEIDEHAAGVYGFTIDPALQGQGLGRAALRRACQELWADGTLAVRLEVAVDNPGALHLYTSLGFEPVSTEDYYAIDL